MRRGGAVATPPVHMRRWPFILARHLSRLCSWVCQRTQRHVGGKSCFKTAVGQVHFSVPEGLVSVWCHMLSKCGDVCCFTRACRASRNWNPCMAQRLDCRPMTVCALCTARLACHGLRGAQTHSTSSSTSKLQ